MRAIALLDGIHDEANIRAGLEALRQEQGIMIVGGLIWRGKGMGASLGDFTEIATAEQMPTALISMLEKTAPEAVVDLLGPGTRTEFRNQLAAATVAHGVTYRGPDFTFHSPKLTKLPCHPAVSLMGLGGSSGKTMLASHLVELHRKRASGRAVVIGINRFGEAYPEVANGERSDFNVRKVLSSINRNRNSLGNHQLVALASRSMTVGCHALGLGMTGVGYSSIIPDAALLALELGASLFIYDPDGASMPSVETDTYILTIKTESDPAILISGLRMHRIYMADLVVLMMEGTGIAQKNKAAEWQRRLVAINSGLRIVRVVVEPVFLGPEIGETPFIAGNGECMRNSRINYYLGKSHIKPISSADDLDDQSKATRRLEKLISAGHRPSSVWVDPSGNGLADLLSLCASADLPVGIIFSSIKDAFEEGFDDLLWEVLAVS